MMDSPTSATIQSLAVEAASLLVYRSVLAGKEGRAFVELLEALLLWSRDPIARHSGEGRGDRSAISCLHAYGRWFELLADRRQSWSDFLIAQILADDNPFTRQVQQVDLDRLSPSLVEAVKYDLDVLQHLASCTGDRLGHWVREISGLSTLPAFSEVSDADAPDPAIARSPIRQFQQAPSWRQLLPELAAFYRHSGTGLFGRYRAFTWHAGALLGIAHPDPVTLSELVGYERPRELLLKNTEFLLAGLPALNVLLYGSRGTGKSSLVKALANAYADRGLRLIQVAKSELTDLPAIVEQLRDLPQKFVIFVDDLSFEDDDDAFKALKVVLEGTITARPANVVVYATSNRRHLVRELFEERPRPSAADEVHAWDTVQEKLSFSDRFGLTLTFEPADQQAYLEIVRHLADLEQLAIDDEALVFQALQWATRRNGRSGRTARHFIDFLKSELTLGGSPGSTALS
jgi:predicted AAA+ superfamily ATPase